MRFLSSSFSELIVAGKSAIQFPNELQSLEEMIHAKLKDHAKTIGIEIPQFSVGVMRFSDKSQEAINTRYHAVKLDRARFFL